jgi:hypothetical protein
MRKRSKAIEKMEEKKDKEQKNNKEKGKALS